MTNRPETLDKFGDESVGKAVGKIVVPSVGAHVDEGEDGQRGPLVYDRRQPLHGSAWPRDGYRHLTELNVRRVGALWQLDANGIALAVGPRNIREACRVGARLPTAR